MSPMRFPGRAAAFSLAAAFVLGAGLSGCSGAREKIAVLEGNSHLAAGRTHQAVAAFARAAGHPASRPYADLGLGCAYLSMGEPGPALARFRAAADSIGATPGEEPAAGERELAFRARYDAGLAFFALADWAGAADSFRAALELDGSRMGAKRNLELSLRMLSREASSAASSAPLSAKEDDDAGPRSLFDYVREKDGERWRSREWRADAGSSLDY